MCLYIYNYMYRVLGRLIQPLHVSNVGIHSIRRRLNDFDSDSRKYLKSSMPMLPGETIIPRSTVGHTSAVLSAFGTVLPDIRCYERHDNLQAHKFLSGPSAGA